MKNGCTYSTCPNPATHVWERTPEEILLLSQKRTYRALKNAEMRERPYRPRTPGKGSPLAVFLACDGHVPSWRRDVFVPGLRVAA